MLVVRKSLGRRTSGLTLLEILVSLVILAMVLTGLSNVFLAARVSLNHAQSRIAAAEVARYVLAPLQDAVRQDSYDTGLLSVTASRAGDSITLDNITYDSTFTVTNVSNLPLGGLLRSVTVQIEWNETR